VSLPRLGFPLAIAGRGTVANTTGAVQNRRLGNIHPARSEASVSAGLRFRLAYQGALAAYPTFERSESGYGSGVYAQ